MIKVEAVNIKSSLPIREIRPIFGNANTVKEFMQEELGFKSEDFKGISKDKLNEMLVQNWDYEKALKFVRNKFEESPKAKRGAKGFDEMKRVIDEWSSEHKNEKLNWPFSGMNGFDQKIMTILRSEESFEEQKNEAFKAVEKYMYMKDINTARNDYIEYLIIKNNPNVMPTLANAANVDFYIDGNKYDQKVSRSVEKHFIKAHPDDWKEVALAHPELVAKNLYEQQGNDRFDKNWRLYIVFINDDMTNLDITKLKTKIENFKVDEPYTIDFSYKEKGQAEQEYETKCLCLIID